MHLDSQMKKYLNHSVIVSTLSKNQERKLAEEESLQVAPELTTTTGRTAGPDNSKTAPSKLPLENSPSPHCTCKHFSSIPHLVSSTFYLAQEIFHFPVNWEVACKKSWSNSVSLTVIVLLVFKELAKEVKRTRFWS